MNYQLLIINLKKIFILIFIFFISACTQSIEIKIEAPILIETPEFIGLENKMGKPLGRAFLAKDNIWIAPDHLYEKSKELFCDGERILVLARDFDQDLLAFELSTKKGKVLDMSDMPPEIGKQIYWFDGVQKSSTILAVGVEFEANLQKKSNLISFSGETVPGASGGVVFDEKGKVWGMIIGADRMNKEIFAVRSDNISAFIEVVE